MCGVFRISWHPNCISACYATALFKVVEDPLFANYGVHGLEDDTAAKIAKIELARSVRQARPRLVGQLFDP